MALQELATGLQFWSTLVSKTKPIIAVDIDDVISAQNDQIRQFANKHYGHKHTYEEFINFEAEYWDYWAHVWGISKEEERQRVKHYIDSGGLLIQKPVKGAIKAINKLKKKFDLVVITSRQDDYIDDTHRWLDKHFPATFRGVHFAKVWEDGRRESKANICKKVNAGYLIDDNAEHCNLAAEEGVKGLLFGDYGWNRSEKLHPMVSKVNNWEEVQEFFEHETSR